MLPVFLDYVCRFAFFVSSIICYHSGDFFRASWLVSFTLSKCFFSIAVDATLLSFSVAFAEVVHSYVHVAEIVF